MTFRVWAPNATAVAVRIVPDGVPAVEVPLAQEAKGQWSIETDQARPGDAYAYALTVRGPTPAGIDPYALDTVDIGTPAQARAAVVFDADGFDWGETPWAEPPFDELVIYELHVGSFNPRATEPVGSFAGVIEKLPYLHDLGINAIELLPVAGFEGAQSWGYDPGAPFSVARAYGGTEGLLGLVKAAHATGIAVLLDVVYK